jgi:mannan endo-1,6-alpha-mannosidase
VVQEPSCISQCTLPQRAYKALLIRWLARTALDAPFVTTQIQTLLVNSANAVIGGCSSGSNSTCVINGQRGLGEQLTALDSAIALLIAMPAGSGSPSGTASSGGGSQPSQTKASAATRTIMVEWGHVLSLAVLACVLPVL